MKTKTRVVSSVVIAFLYVALNQLYKFVYSPITAKATANSLSDNPPDYFLAKFIRDGGVEHALSYVALFLLIVIWTGYFCKCDSQTKK
jgi:uncharacterized oligopeptide transporter (OPT) family protein